MNVKKLIEQMIAIGKEIITPTNNPRQWRGPTPSKHYRGANRQNHGQGESKARRKMAARSRRINRKYSRR